MKLSHASLPIGILIGLICFFILWKIFSARRGKQLFIRKIPGLNAIDEAVGRAAEMGRPILFAPGIIGIDISTLQALSILKHVIKIAAKYRTRVIVPTADAVVYTLAEDLARDTYAAEGVPELFDQNDIRFLSENQFAYASGVVGIINREMVASNMMFGYFAGESLILAESGNRIGAIQVAGTPKIDQIPFFLTTCDYTIIGDEFYAASAYLSREPTLLGSLVGQDYAKAALMIIIIAGIITSTLMNIYPEWQNSVWNWLKWFQAS